MPRNKRFCAFILTHGRPDNVRTYGCLRHHGYTGDIRLIVDDQDKTLPQYVEKYGDEVVVFSKDEAAAITDAYDNFPERRAVVYARNACHGIAAKLGYEHFLVLDDDYNCFVYRFDAKGQFFGGVTVKNMDAACEAFCKFMDRVPSCKSIAFSQGGDFIGGAEGKNAKTLTLLRKCMNSFFCKTDRPFKFMGKINEDVNAYTVHGSRGELFFTMPQVQLIQAATQAQSGGLTDIYLSFGTYVKSFYSVIGLPSAVSISSMGRYERRIHHRVDWNACTPKIVPESCKK